MYYWEEVPTLPLLVRPPPMYMVHYRFVDLMWTPMERDACCYDSYRLLYIRKVVLTQGVRRHAIGLAS